MRKLCLLAISEFLKSLHYLTCTGTGQLQLPTDLILCFQYANCTKPSGETNVSIQHLVLCLWFILLLRLEASTCCCTVSANCSTFRPRNRVLHKETIQSVEEHHQTYLPCVFSLCCMAKRLNLILYFISHQSLFLQLIS